MPRYLGFRVFPLINSRYQVRELTSRWTALLDVPVTESFVLQCAVEKGIPLYMDCGERMFIRVWLHLKSDSKTMPKLSDMGEMDGTDIKLVIEIGKPLVPAYTYSEYIQIHKNNIRELLKGKTTAINFLDPQETKIITENGQPSYDVDEIESILIDDEKIIQILPINIQYLWVKSDDIEVFEQGLRGFYKNKMLMATESLSGQNGAAIQFTTGGSNPERNSTERGYTIWLRKVWIKENRPEGAAFFNALKKYKGQHESLVIDWWNTSPNGQGVKLRTITRTIELPRSQIQKIVTKFKGQEREQ